MTRADQMGIAITFKGLMAVAEALEGDGRSDEAKEVRAMSARLREIAWQTVVDQESKDQ